MTFSNERGYVKSMNLKTWKEQQQMNNKELADLLKVDESYVSLILNGKRKGSPVFALAVEQITKGMVSRMDILYPED